MAWRKKRKSSSSSTQPLSPTNGKEIKRTKRSSSSLSSLPSSSKASSQTSSTAAAVKNKGGNGQRERERVVREEHSGNGNGNGNGVIGRPSRESSTPSKSLPSVPKPSSLGEGKLAQEGSSPAEDREHLEEIAYDLDFDIVDWCITTAKLRGIAPENFLDGLDLPEEQDLEIRRLINIYEVHEIRRSTGVSTN